ncbi:tyrosine-type recombinase/integrase [Halorientalis brevis]|uniref:Tyrosine-type recombinase/integrase n=1 Tax=Halorientalis brevis TaxID=1126241 RepID=A0ABD6CE74_9EURY|nr:site-specific integrase [Halorientalis brevis]
MSGETPSEDGARARQDLADAIGRCLDPLAEFEQEIKTTFATREIDPLDIAQTKVVESRCLTERTRNEYDRVFRQWREHMHQQGRYLACPSEEHVHAFIERERETKGNADKTVISKLERLNVAYEYWQNDPAFPHSQEYNPFRLAKQQTDFSGDSPKEVPRIPITELQDIVGAVTDIRDLAILTLQLKLGLRATELCNLRLSDLCLEHDELNRHYESLGECAVLENRQNAVYIPHDRDGNKSPCPRILPLDNEVRRIVSRYLLLRPTRDTPEIFLSKARHLPLNKQAVNDVWKETFHPTYSETDEYRAVTSHFGRHRFTTYWRVEQGMNRELIKYMRGDRFGSTQADDRASIHDYIHTYYEDIEPIYRDQIFTITE